MDVNKDVYLTMATRREAGRGCAIFPRLIPAGLPSSWSGCEPSDDVTGACRSLLSFAN